MRLLILFLCITFSGCTAKKLTYGPMPNPAQYNYIKWAVKHIDVSDGVQRYEARVIAGAFFVSGISGCGAPGEPEKQKDKWVFPTYVGIAARPSHKIYIDRKTGNVQWQEVTKSFMELQNLKLMALPDVDI